mmetsp:Transcript_21394/g.64266  ORF Transcript_21394/g.64266 Transcript_21394/m.64266 type:complete len:202 (+) Transcript_21394:146-751(+)
MNRSSSQLSCSFRSLRRLSRRAAFWPVPNASSKPPPDPASSGRSDWFRKRCSISARRARVDRSFLSVFSPGGARASIGSSLASEPSSSSSAGAGPRGALYAPPSVDASGAAAVSNRGRSAAAASSSAESSFAQGHFTRDGVCGVLTTCGQKATAAERVKQAASIERDAIVRRAGARRCVLMRRDEGSSAGQQCCRSRAQAS